MKNINEENVFDILEKAFGEKVEEKDDEVVFQIERMGHKLNIVAKKSQIINEVVELKDYSFVDASLYEKRHFYVALKTSGLVPLRYDCNFSVEDCENGFSYSISRHMPLKYYLAVLDSFLDEADGIEKINIRRWGPFVTSSRTMELFFAKESVSLAEVIDAFIRIKIIQIESKNEKKLDEFNALVSSYVFTISYNYNIVFVPYRNILDLLPRRFLSKSRRNSLMKSGEEFDPPRRKYDSELVNHYQMALVSDSPYLAYLSYYHVIEHFFDSVVDDDLVNKVRSKLTMPDFSYKRKKDIKDLVKIINSATQIKDERTVYNELNALKLTLKKYINLAELKNELTVDGLDYLAYLKANTVKFSNGNTVNFDNDDEVDVYSNLSRRIYNTRNALVHSKEMEQSKYRPFHDEKELQKEIFLISCIAEKIILATSTEL